MSQNNNISYQTIYSTQIYLNSANADLFLNYSKEDKSNVVFFFKEALKIERNSIETRVSIVDAQIPVSWYLINSTNNKITITVNNISTTYLFPHGNYNVYSFINAWYSVVGNNSIWNLTFNSTTNKLLFHNYQNTEYYFTDLGNSIFPIIGFSNGNTYSSNVTGDILSNNVINFAGLTKLNIKTSTFTTRNIDSKNKGHTRALASVPVNSSANGIIYYYNNNDYKSIFRNYELSSIGIEILDDFKNYVEFNNIDWTITLQIDVVMEIVNNLETMEDIYNNLNQEL